MAFPEKAGKPGKLHLTAQNRDGQFLLPRKATTRSGMERESAKTERGRKSRLGRWLSAAFPPFPRTRGNWQKPRQASPEHSFRRGIERGERRFSGCFRESPAPLLAHFPNVKYL